MHSHNCDILCIFLKLVNTHYIYRPLAFFRAGHTDNPLFTETVVSNGGAPGPGIMELSTEPTVEPNPYC